MKWNYPQIMVINKTRQEKALQNLKDFVQRNELIKGMWTVGSLAKRNYDVFSDIDVYLLVEENNFEEVYNNSKKFAERLGEILSTFKVTWDNCKMLGVIYANGLEVDYCYTTLTITEIFDAYKIEVDKLGNLEDILETKKVAFSPDIEEDLTRQIEFAPYNFLNAIHQLARGNLWSAHHHLETLRNRAIKMLYVLDDKIPDEERSGFDQIVDNSIERAFKKSFVKMDQPSLTSGLLAMFKIFEALTDRLPDNLAKGFQHEILTLKSYQEKVHTSL